MRSEDDAGPSRRTLLGVTAISAAVLGGCGGRPRHLRPAVPAQEPPLVQALLGALDLERQTIAAYAAAVPLLGHRAGRAAQRFLGLELSHAAEIAGLIAQAGVRPPKDATAYDLGHPRSAGDVLKLLHDLEARQLALYLDLVPRASDGKVRAALSAVLGSDAQHLAVLATLRGENPIPSPLP